MEEKKFFVKDFIKYCSPCFGCDKPMNLRLGFRDKNGTVGHSVATVTDKYVEVELNIRYRSNLKLWVFHRNHKVLTSDDVAFSHYLSERHLYLLCDCSFCSTEIASQDLDFQTFNKVLAPTTLQMEHLIVYHKDKQYSLTSNFDEGVSTGIVHSIIRKVHGPGIAPTPKDLVFKMPLLPKYKLGNKQHLIKKLNTYAIFS